MNQQWPHNPETPHGAWEYHETIIPKSQVKPIRIWMSVGDRDLFDPGLMGDDLNDWVLANEEIAKMLATKDHNYQLSFVQNVRHCDSAMKAQLLP